MSRRGWTRDRSKVAIVTFLGVLFCVCVFLLAAAQYGLYDLLFASFRPQQPVERVSAIASTTRWDYMDSGFEPGIGNVWTTDEYSSANWNKNSGVFAANPAAIAPSGTPVIPLNLPVEQPQASPTCFFRTVFNVDNTAPFHAITGSIRYSDAVVVYLNGKIIFAGNVPAGGYESNQEARTAEPLDTVQEASFTVTDLSALRNGENILAVELHQDNVGNENAYFFFEAMELQTTAVSEPALDVQHLILQPGHDETEIILDWLTSDAGYYQVEYWEAAQFDADSEHTSAYAQSVILGRRFLPGVQQYRNTATLKRLKTDTEYVYRLVKTGNKDGSDFMRFQTKPRTGFSVMLLGDPQLGAYDTDDAKRWDSSVTAAVAALGKPNLVFSAGDQVDGIGEQADIIKCYLDFRAPVLFREVPLLTIPGNHDALDSTTQLYREQFSPVEYTAHGDSWFTYQDVLFVSLNSNSTDYAAHKEFLDAAIATAKRNWVVVLIHHSIFSEGNHAQSDSMTEMRAEFSAIFEAANVDLVLSGHDHMYSRSVMMQGDTPAPPAENGKKRMGETLYITAGSSSGTKFYDAPENKEILYTAFCFPEKIPVATRIDEANNALRIRTYRTDTAQLLDEYLLQK